MTKSGSLNTSGEAVLKFKKNYFKAPGSYNLNFLFKETGNTKTVTIKVSAPPPPTGETLREAIVRIANEYFIAGHKEIPFPGGVDVNGNPVTASRRDGGFADPVFFKEMIENGFDENKKVPGLYDSHWCNIFTNLVYDNAYIQVSRYNSQVRDIYNTKFKGNRGGFGIPGGGATFSRDVIKTINQATALGTGVRFGVNGSGGIYPGDPKMPLPKPGDCIVYTGGHIQIVTKIIDPNKKIIQVIGGNEGGGINKKNVYLMDINNVKNQSQWGSTKPEIYGYVFPYPEGSASDYPY